MASESSTSPYITTETPIEIRMGANFEMEAATSTLYNYWNYYNIGKKSEG